MRRRSRQKLAARPAFQNSQFQLANASSCWRCCARERVCPAGEIDRCARFVSKCSIDSVDFCFSVNLTYIECSFSGLSSLALFSAGLFHSRHEHASNALIKNVNSSMQLRSIHSGDPRNDAVRGMYIFRYPPLPRVQFMYRYVSL